MSARAACSPIDMPAEVHRLSHGASTTRQADPHNASCKQTCVQATQPQAYPGAKHRLPLRVQPTHPAHPHTTKHSK